MEQTKYDVFISYSRHDYVDDHENVIPNNEVSKIMEALTDAGITYWIDREGIYSGDKFTEELPKIIKLAPIFVYLSTANANKSKYTSKEIAIADEYGKYIIPVRIDMSPYSDKVIFRIADISFIKYAVNPTKGREDLVNSIKAHLKEIELIAKSEAEKQFQRDANTSFLTGNEFYYGMNGKEMDYTEAVYWYRKAAEKGHIEAMYSLGNCYYHGKGVTRNYNKAKDLYERAAELGHMGAQFNLGRCYKKGFGTPVNYIEAFAWFLKAAEQGYALAQNNVAVCYEQGIGVPVSEDNAVKWYQLANEQGDAFAHEALIRLGKLLKS